MTRCGYGGICTSRVSGYVLDYGSVCFNARSAALPECRMMVCADWWVSDFRGVQREAEWASNWDCFR